MNDNNYDGCKGCTQYEPYKKYSGDISLKNIVDLCFRSFSRKLPM
jgi:hypothetical protein